MSDQAFVSSYSWLLAPGDCMQPDYSTPTRVKQWLQTTLVRPFKTDVDKNMAYGQWIVQLLECQLGIPLVTLYKTPPPTAEEWPLKLRPDVIAVLDQYFEKNKTEQCSA
jgi:hypothetical protein